MKKTVLRAAALLATAALATSCNSGQRQVPYTSGTQGTAAPPITILTHDAQSNGDIFIAPAGGTDYIYNDHYKQIATVTAGNGYMTNFHEFFITPWNTALILASKAATANLTSMGGPADQQVMDDAVQEIDISTGRVLFQWDAAGHIP